MFQDMTGMGEEQATVPAIEKKPSSKAGGKTVRRGKRDDLSLLGRIDIEIARIGIGGFSLLRVNLDLRGRMTVHYNSIRARHSICD